MYLLRAGVRTGLRAGAMGATGAMSAAHGYSNKAYYSARQHNPCAPKPLKQLMVTTC